MTLFLALLVVALLIFSPGFRALCMALTVIVISAGTFLAVAVMVVGLVKVLT